MKIPNKLRYTATCEHHGKVIHFNFDKKGDWLHISDVEKLLKTSKKRLEPPAKESGT